MESSLQWLGWLSTAIILGLVVVDAIIGLWVKPSKFYQRRDTANNLAIATINFIFRHLLSLSLVTAFMLWGYQMRAASFELNQWYAWIGCFLLVDFLGYTRHYLLHKIRLLWSLHVVHHSSEYYNHAVDLRSSPFIDWVRAPFYGFVCFLGFPPTMVIIMLCVVKIYDVILHNPHIKSLGFLEKIIMTPSHHRAHHGQNPQYRDKNFGFVLIFWDKLFKTFEPEGEPVVYGVVNPITRPGLYHLLFGELESLLVDVRQAKSLRAALWCFVQPPGSVTPAKTESQNPALVQDSAVKESAASIPDSDQRYG